MFLKVGNVDLFYTIQQISTLWQKEEENVKL